MGGNIFNQNYGVDSAEFEVGPEDPWSVQDDSAPEPVSQAPTPALDVDEPDMLVEAEKRITLARYYQQLTQGGIFSVDSVEAAQVDKEVRQFARERMAVLLNIQQGALPTPQKIVTVNQFSDEEVAYLKALVTKTKALSSPMAAPQIRKIEAPPQLAVEKPLPTQVKAEPKVTSKPVADKPVSTPPKSPAKAKKVKDASQIPTGVKFKEKGQDYVWVTDPSGLVDAQGNPNRIKKNVSKKVDGGHGIPMPTNLTKASEMAAQRVSQAVTGGGSNPLMNKLLGQLLK